MHKYSAKEGISPQPELPDPRLAGQKATFYQQASRRGACRDHREHEERPVSLSEASSLSPIRLH
jgi:hypothetical protein